MRDPLLLGKLKFKSEEMLVLLEGKYEDDTPCVKIRSETKPADDTDLWATLTVCLGVGKKVLEPTEFIVKTWGENQEITDALLKSGLFIDTAKRIPTGYVVASIWQLA